MHALPIGAFAYSQGLHPALSKALEQAAQDGLATNDEKQIGRSAPGMAMASSWHDTQYSRLFRS